MTETLFQIPEERYFYIRHIQPNFGYWFAGLCDGEAHLQVRAHYREMGNRQWWSCYVALRIGLRADDLDALQYIKQSVGCGRIANAHRQAVIYGNSKPQKIFTVSRAHDLLCIIVPTLIKYPMRAKKAREFPLWARAVEIAYKASVQRSHKGERNLSDQEWKEVQEIERRLREIRVYDSDNHNQDKEGGLCKTIN